MALLFGPISAAARIREHYRVIENVGRPFDFSVDEAVRLADLSGVREGFEVVLDQPKWFMREGQLSLNLFLQNERIYTLAFSFFYEGDKLSALVGAIQGRDIEGILHNYRDLTEAAHGMRPRDLLIEVFRMLCEAAGVSAIVAVSDEFRHQRSSYFGPHEKDFSTNYNEIWADRGGIRTSPMFYSLDVVSPRKDLSSIPSKKRAMYRKRFEMLDSIRQKILRTYGRRVDEVAADSLGQGDQIDDVLAPERSADQQHP